MRTLKFRFWNTMAKKFQQPSKYAIDGDGHLVSYDYEMGEFSDAIKFENSCIIAQQFTGIKGVDGVEIYEGDIVKYVEDADLHPNGYDQEVIWNEHSWYFRGDGLICEYVVDDVLFKSRVIGNILENPDLVS